MRKRSRKEEKEKEQHNDGSRANCTTAGDLLPPFVEQLGSLRAERLHPLKKLLCLLELCKQLLFCLKFRRMHTTPAPTQLHRMLQVQHLVIDDVFDDVLRNAMIIEYPADDDCVVRRVVMPEPVTRAIAAPGHLRTSQQAMEEPEVQLIEYRLEIISVSLCRRNALAAAHLPYQVSLTRHVLGRNISPVVCGTLAIHRPAVHFCQQNVGDRPQNVFRRAFQ